MKKYNLYLWLLALVGLMTSCSQDETDALQNEASNRVTIGASISEALQTRAASVTIPDGYKLRYVLEVRKNTESEFPPSESSTPIWRYEETKTDASGVDFEFTLEDAGNYKALLWADFIPTGATTSTVNSPNTYTHYADHHYKTNSEDGLKIVELLKTNTDYVINDDTRDAFFACIDIKKGTGAFERDVELKRPFGQINVIEKNTDLLAKVESMTLEYEVPIKFNLEEDYSWNQKVAVKPTVNTLPNVTDARKANLFYDFIFTSARSQTTLGEIKLTFTDNDPSVTLEEFIIPSNMPAVRNKRTNISGYILHTSSVPSGSAKLSVTVSDGWTTEPNKEEDIDEIVLAKQVLGTAWSSGSSNNAEDYHYTITTLGQLEALSTLTKAGTVITGCTKSYGFANYKLGNNISLENKPWTPIDDFHGTFDGQGYTISNMNVSITSQSQSGISGGLFEYIGGTVSNLIVEGTVTVNGEGDCIAGGICGQVSGTIEFCRFNGSVSSTTSNNEKLNYAGGITGDRNAMPTITGCIANAKVTISGGKNDKSAAGGLAGYIDGSDCKYSAWNNASSEGTSVMIGKNRDDSSPTACNSFTTISGLNDLLPDINSNVPGSTYIWQAGSDSNAYPKLVLRQSPGN